MKFNHPHLDPLSRGRMKAAAPSAPARLKNHLAAALLALVIIAMGAPAALADGWDPNTNASNTGGITNTRHNMSFSYGSGMEGIISNVNNRYGEVCVYCHTPHGSNSTVPKAPLWNRTVQANTYTLYNIPLQSGQTPTQPGVNSLTCLSCHDGVTAIDSIINMPGSGRYSAAQETSVSYAFLDTWPDPRMHFALASSDYSGLENGCMECHDGSLGGAPLFTAFVIGTDLTDDHPVGVNLPDTNTYDFKEPTATDGALKFFDGDGDGRADPDEVRFY
ncbi:MAG: hypothetical protein ACNS63_13635, partial [Candidatus Nitrospinota bacterium M3_3B_026]